MQTNQLAELAAQNLESLSLNPYPGRGIIMGLDETGKYLIQVYFIMGRSLNSRNRIFELKEEGALFTAPADPSKVEDASLIIYQAMAENITDYAVSNGHQTEDAVEMQDINEFLDKWRYEPDSPNYTPRITGILDVSNDKPMATFFIQKKSPFSEVCNNYIYHLDVSSPGFGYCITTYKGDGNPLPSFEGDPYLLPFSGDSKQIAQTIWDNLNEENRVSLAVKFINIETEVSTVKIINKYEAVVV